MSTIRLSCVRQAVSGSSAVSQQDVSSVLSLGRGFLCALRLAAHTPHVTKCEVRLRRIPPRAQAKAT